MTAKEKAAAAAKAGPTAATPVITPVTPAVPDEVKPETPPTPPPERVGLDFGQFLPAEALPIIAIFQPPFSTAKLWAFCSAAAKFGPVVEAFIHSRFATKGDVPVTEAVDVPFTQHFAAFQPASTIGTDELVQQFHAACGCPDGTHGDEAVKMTAAAPVVTMNPVIAGILAALIKRAAEELARRLAGG